MTNVIIGSERRGSVRERPTPTISVVIPTLNEARNLPHVFERLSPDIDEVLLVDGGSTDGTVETAQALWPGIRVIGQTRRGKGNALACGFRAAKGDIVVMLDADGSADPEEIPLFVERLLEGHDFAKGTRFALGGGSVDITRLRRLGNMALNMLVNRVYGTRYTDLCYGYNAFWRRRCLPVLGLDEIVDAPAADGQRLWGDGFEIETLINVRVAIAGLRVGEVPSFEHDRIHGTSNLRTFSDGMRVLRTIAVERRFRRSREALLAKSQPTRVAEQRPEPMVIDLRDIDAGATASAREQSAHGNGLCTHGAVERCRECAAA